MPPYPWYYGGKFYQHIFTDTTIKDTPGCKAKPIMVEDSVWDATQTAGDMTPAMNCQVVKFDKTTLDNLNAKNKELTALSDQIITALNTSSSTSDSTSQHVNQKKQVIQNHQDLLNKSSSNIEYIMKNQDTIDGKEHVTKIAMNSALQKYIVWMIVAATIFLITVYSIYFNQNNLAYVVVLVALLLILYRYSGYIYDRL